MTSQQLAQTACGFPDRLHPVSQLFLDNYVSGTMSTENFVRFFSLPNSDYLELAYCFVSLFGAAGAVI